MQSKLCLMSMERAAEELDFMQFGTLKLMFVEQVHIVRRLVRCVRVRLVCGIGSELVRIKCMVENGIGAVAGSLS